MGVECNAHTTLSLDFFNNKEPKRRENYMVFFQDFSRPWVVFILQCYFICNWCLSSLIRVKYIKFWQNLLTWYYQQMKHKMFYMININQWSSLFAAHLRRYQDKRPNNSLVAYDNKLVYSRKIQNWTPLNRKYPNNSLLVYDNNLVYLRKLQKLNTTEENIWTTSKTKHEQRLN